MSAPPVTALHGARGPRPAQPPSEPVHQQRRPPGTTPAPERPRSARAAASGAARGCPPGTNCGSRLRKVTGAFGLSALVTKPCRSGRARPHRPRARPSSATTRLRPPRPAARTRPASAACAGPGTARSAPPSSWSVRNSAGTAVSTAATPATASAVWTQQPARDAERAGDPGPARDEGVAYDDGEVRARHGDHARGDPGEGDQLCVHAAQPARTGLQQVCRISWVCLKQSLGTALGGHVRPDPARGAGGGRRGGVDHPGRRAPRLHPARALPAAGQAGAGGGGGAAGTVITAGRGSPARASCWWRGPAGSWTRWTWPGTNWPG